MSNFELNLMTIDDDRLGIPDTPYEVTVSMSSTEFQRICRDLSVLGDTCVIACSPDKVVFRVVGGDLGNGCITLLPSAVMDDSSSVPPCSSIEATSSTELTFSLRYLTMFSKSAPLSNTVVLSMSDNMPLRVEYPIDGVGHVQFYLAPKIDED